MIRSRRKGGRQIENSGKGKPPRPQQMIKGGNITRRTMLQIHYSMAQMKEKGGYIMDKDETRVQVFQTKERAERALLALRETMDDYSFAEIPTVQALKTEAVNSETGTAGGNATKWIYEYERIRGFLDITFDYLLQVTEDLRQLEADLERS